jgi:hypothetical protein
MPIMWARGTTPWAAATASSSVPPPSAARRRQHDETQRGSGSAGIEYTDAGIGELLLRQLCALTGDTVSGGEGATGDDAQHLFGALVVGRSEGL